MVSLQAELVLEKDDGTKLRGVVFDIKAVLLTLDDSMASTHTDVVDPNLGLMATTKFELGLLGGHCQKMDIPRGILVQRHGLEQDVVTRRLSGDLVSLINNLVDGWSHLEGVWIHLLADLALESLPVERSHILVMGTRGLLLLLSENPGLQALEMDETDGASALACDNQRVGGVVLITPADSALDLILGSVVDVLGTFDLHGLSELLLIKFFFRHVNVVAPEVLDSESNTTKLNCVEFFDFVVIFTVFILQRSGN